MLSRDVLQLNRIAGARYHAVAFNKYPLVWIAPIQLLRVRGNPHYRAVIIDEGIGTGPRGRWEFGLLLNWNISLWHNVCPSLFYGQTLSETGRPVMRAYMRMKPRL
jgi:hypothetical protein